MTDAGDDVVQRITLAPDAGLVKSLGANHTLESAIADLVDNSVDAGCSQVAVRLLTHNDRLVRVEVIDDGCGMDDATANAAMTIGHRREYVDGDLGHFGMGLKAASFGHCDVLTVWSSIGSETHVGRRIRRTDFSKDFTCEVLSPNIAKAHADTRRAIVESERGTTVVWTEVRNAYRGRDPEEARRWLSIRHDALRVHLGVVFHRLLSDSRLRVHVLVDELGDARHELGVPVLPIDPFGYPMSGHPEYPKSLVAKAGNTRVRLKCHIWPPRTDITGFRMGTRSGEAFQGFYIYRNNRLLQVGGWSHTVTPSAARQLARVVLEDKQAIGSFLTMNPEKSGLKFEPAFHDAIGRAISKDGTTFAQYLQDAESVHTEASRRKFRRHPAIRPEKGLAPSLRRQIGRELPFIDSDPIDLKWRRLPLGEFIDMDFRSKTLWINSRYRSLFAPSGGSLNDAPVIKALLYLLTHQVFEGQHLGARDKDQILLWKSILGAAVTAEHAMRGDE